MDAKTIEFILSKVEKNIKDIRQAIKEDNHNRIYYEAISSANLLEQLASLIRSTQHQ